MPGPLRDDERRDPLPGLFELPGHMLRQLGRRGRWIAAGAAVLIAALVAAGFLFLAPDVRETKRESEQAAVESAEQRRAERIERLKAEVSPHKGAARALATPTTEHGDDAVRRRRAVMRSLEAAVLDDARERAASGELRIPVRSVGCERFPRSADDPPPEEVTAAATGRYECLAITSVIKPGEELQRGASGLIGYPFRALVDFTAGTYAWCKISGRAGEGGLRGKPEVPVPAACGGG